jgi:hypothetical protein
MIIKIPKDHQYAVKYACEVYAVPVQFYTDEKCEGLVKVDIEVSPEEAWIISAEAHIKMKEDAEKAREKRRDDLFNMFKVTI